MCAHLLKALQESSSDVIWMTRLVEITGGKLRQPEPGLNLLMKTRMSPA